MAKENSIPQAVWNTTEALGQTIASLIGLSEHVDEELASITKKQATLKRELEKLGEVVQAQATALKEWDEAVLANGGRSVLPDSNGATTQSSAETDFDVSLSAQPKNENASNDAPSAPEKKKPAQENDDSGDCSEVFLGDI